MPNTDSFTDAFRTFPSVVFLLSTRAGGVGLNLIGANRLFLLEPEWNPALDQQAMARIHRDGQQKHCFIYRMMLSGTMDEKIFQRQITKLGLSDTLMNTSSSKDRKNVGRGGDSGKRGKGGDSFSQEELKDIFTLHEDTPCLCHDLLICTCGGKGVLIGEGEQGGDGDGEHSSDEESPPPPSFIPASMQQATRDAQVSCCCRAQGKLIIQRVSRSFDDLVSVSRSHTTARKGSSLPTRRPGRLATRRPDGPRLLHSPQRRNLECSRGRPGADAGWRAFYQAREGTAR